MEHIGVQFRVTLHKKFTRKRWTLTVYATTSPNAIETAYQLMMKSGFKRDEIFWDRVEAV